MQSKSAITREAEELGHVRRAQAEIQRADARHRAFENEARGRERGKARDAAHRRTDLRQAQGRGGAAGQRGFFGLSAGKSLPRSTASAGTGSGAANRACSANRAEEAQSAQPADMGGGHRGGGRGGHARLSDAHRPEHPGPRGQARRLNLYRTPAPSHRSRIGQSAGGCGRPTLRRLGSSDADQDERRHLRGEPQHRPGARLDLVLELRRLQPDLASLVRLPERGSGEGLRMDQQHPRRQEFADLRHPRPYRDAGGRLQHLSRALRRLANGGDGERRGNHGPRSRRAREHRSQDRGALFRHRRAEGHRGVLRPPDSRA